MTEFDYGPFAKVRDDYINCPAGYKAWDIKNKWTGFKVLEDPEGHWTTLWAMDGRVLKPRHNEDLGELVKRVIEDALHGERPLGRQDKW